MATEDLNIDYHGKYCSCCGRQSQDIWNNLVRQRPDKDGKRKWKEHTLYPKTSLCGKNNSFYDSNETNFCEECGLELNDEDYNTAMENRGECHGAPAYEQVLYGYKCSNCGHKEKF